jgi:predicted nucleotidyltransferase
MEPPLSVLSQIAAILEQQGIRYVLVGSFASSIHGMYRATADIDIVADIKTEQVHSLFEALRNDFYVDEQVMRDAIIQRGSFNAIHFGSVFKVDFFVPKSEGFSKAELDRRQLRRIAPDRDEAVYVATAEDTILAKLRWFRAGNETSNNQWNDVVGVLGTSQHTLDFDYLRTWAEELELTDLLDKALDDVREDSGI